MSKPLRVRHEVQLFRESVGKLVALLTSRSIKVTESGADAFCEWEKGILKRINLPSIPDDASDRLLFAMHGFVDHEVAHVLYTDPMVSKALSGETGHHFWNVIEDIYIERRMSDVFLGCRRNLYKVHAHILDSVFLPDTHKRILASHDDARLFQEWFLMPACRSASGHPAYTEFMEEFWSRFPHQRACMENIRFGERIGKVTSSADCVVLAVDLMNALDELHSEPEEPAGDPAKKAVIRPGKSGDSSSDTPADLSDFDEIEYDPTPAEEDTSSDEEPEAHASAPAEEEEEEEGEEPGPERKMTKEDLDALAGAEATGSMGTEDAISRVIGEEIDAVAPGTYLPYSRTYDFYGHLEDLPDFIDKHKTPEWKFRTPLRHYAVDTKMGLSLFRAHVEPHLRGKLSTLAKELERAVMSHNRTQFIPGQRRGKLHGPSLYRLSINDDRVFRKREETRALNACVQIIVDMSGSMGGPDIVLASASAWAMSDALDKINVPNLVTGFTTIGELKVEDKANRTEPLHLPVLKDWDERANSDIVRVRCGCIVDYPLANNVDGESILALSNHMARRKEDRKIMIVLSDGNPAAVGYGFNDHLRQVIQYIEKTLGYDLLGVGIATDAPRRFYTHSVKIDKTEQLPEIVATALRQILLAGKF